MSSTPKVKVAKLSLLNKKSYNKTAIDFHFSRHKDLSTLKSDIYLGPAASVNYHFFEKINSYVYLIEVNNCILSSCYIVNATYIPAGQVQLRVEICYVAAASKYMPSGLA